MPGKQNKVIEPCACVYLYVCMCMHMACLSGTRLSSAHDRNTQKTWSTCTQYDQPRGGRMSGVRTGTQDIWDPRGGHVASGGPWSAVGLQVDSGMARTAHGAQPEAGCMGHCGKLQPCRPKHGRWGEIPLNPKNDMGPPPRIEGLLGMTVQGHQCSAALLEGQQSSVWAPEVPGDQRSQAQQQEVGERPPQGPAAQLRGPPWSSGVCRRAGGVLWQAAPVPENRLVLLLRNRSPTSHTTGPGQVTQHNPPCHRPGARQLTLTISEAVLGLAPSGEPPSSREQSGPASSSYSVRQSDSSPRIRGAACQ